LTQVSDGVAALDLALANSGHIPRQGGANARFVACLKGVAFDHLDNEPLSMAVQASFDLQK
jgi:hypothetical protein